MTTLRIFVKIRDNELNKDLFKKTQTRNIKESEIKIKKTNIKR